MKDLSEFSKTDLSKLQIADVHDITQYKTVVTNIIATTANSGGPTINGYHNGDVCPAGSVLVMKWQVDSVCKSGDCKENSRCG